jgi:ATP-dependent Clp protease ATP-binding subunit ClpA
LRHAERIAQEHGHDYVGTEHLILGILAEPDGIAGQVLARLGVTADVAARTEEIMSSPGYITSSLLEKYPVVRDAEAEGYRRRPPRRPTG